MHIHTCNVHTSSCICVCGCSCASVHLSIYDGLLILIIIHIWVFDLLLGSFSGTRLLYLQKKWPPSKRLPWKVQGWLFKFENLFKMRRFKTWYVFMLEWLFTWWSQGFFPLPFFHTQRKKKTSHFAIFFYHLERNEKQKHLMLGKIERHLRLAPPTNWLSSLIFLHLSKFKWDQL